jgi:hypothetical protein
MTAGFALQKAIYETLAADAVLKALIGDPPRLHDGRPESPVYPFVAFGDARETRVQGADALAEHDIRLSVHSRYDGRREIAEISERIITALEEAPPVPAGFRLVSLAHVSTEIFRRADIDAHQGLIRLRAVTERL